MGENSGFKRMNNRHTQGNIFISFGFIVAVHILQGRIEFVNKEGQVNRIFFKFNQPFMRTITSITEINRSRRVVFDDSACLQAGMGNGSIGIIRN